MSRYLLVGDVDQIQGYVFAVPRLRAIRGASALVDKLLRELPPSQNLDVLRQHGGQVVAQLDNADKDEASAQCSAWERHFRLNSGGAATITTAYAEYPEGGSFAKTLSKAFEKVQSKKDGGSPTINLLNGSHNEAHTSSPYDRKCDYCRERTASPDPDSDQGRPYWWWGGSTIYLCGACWQRVKTAERGGIRLDNVLFERLDKKLAETNRPAILKPRRLPNDLADLWQEEDPSGKYMAYIAADGNGFGVLQQEINDPGLYQDFAGEIERLSYQAIVEAAVFCGVASNPIKKDGHWIAPFMPVILAGDDLVVLLPAQYAMDFSLQLCNSFAEMSRTMPAIQRVINSLCEKRPKLGKEFFGSDKESRRLTLSIGLAIARSSFPISAYRRFAGELRSSAKKGLGNRAVSASELGGMIDFAMITTATVQSLAEVRRAYVKEGGNRLLTARPYPLNEVNNLLKLSRQFSEQFPRGHRRFLYEGIMTDNYESLERRRFVFGRAKNAGAQIVKMLRDDFHCEIDLSMYRETEKGVKETPLVDALELAELEIRGQRQST